MDKKLVLMAVLLSSLLLLLSCGGSIETVPNIQREKIAYLGTVPFEPPLIYQEEAELVGPDAELGAKIIQRIQDTSDSMVDTPIKLMWINRTYSSLVPALKNREIHFILGVFAITEERKKEILFSDPYYTSELVLVINPVHKNVTPDQLGSANIGVREGTGAEDFVNQKYPSSTVTAFKTLDDAVLALRRSEIDCIVDDKYMAAFSLQETPGAAHMDFGPEVLGRVDCAVGMLKGDQTLQKLVNEVIAELKGSNQFAQWIEEHSDDRVQTVLNRHQERLDQAKKASEPREITIRVTRARNFQIDIYKMANLRFVLTNQTTGEKTSSSPIRFEGSTAVAKATVPPGSYILALHKFNFRATIDIGPNDPKNVPINIRLNTTGVVVRKG
jgi:polar amino acid transport system substrate-binding protein